MNVDKATLDELVALMRRDGLDRVQIEIGDVSLDVRMSAAGSGNSASDLKRSSSAAPPRPALAQADQAPADTVKVLAPLVGMFYRSPAPGAKPFVQVGDEVSAGQVLCIIEAMKLMNEIVSEHNGRVARICASDGQLVSLNEELFWIEA